MLDASLAVNLNQCLMTEETTDYVNVWYDCLNDAFEHQLSFEIISGYLEAITDVDYE